ncbi:MAG: HAMP domain-containing protein [Candidatus Spechtbacteria bacterium]|nr:HAMP domain-containing protein [Candidatus Spechtbacteria bacterium]
MLQTILKFQNIQKENAISQERRIASFVTKEITEFVSLQFSALDNFDNVDSFLPKNFELRQNFLERLLFSHDNFSEITIVDANGQETNRVNRLIVITPRDLAQYLDEEKFLAAKESSHFISQLFWEKNRLFFTIGRGLFDVHNVFQGAVLVKVDARVMQEVVNQLSIVEEGGRAYIVDRSGVVVAHPDISQVLLQKDFSSIPLVSSLIKQKNDISPVAIYRNELNQEVVGAGAPIQISFYGHASPEIIDANWFVIAEIPTFIALAAIREITLFVFLVLAAILFFAVIAAFILARQIVQPIEGLHLVSSEFGKGNLDYKIPIHTDDEIEDLAFAFYNMSANLKKSFATITRSNEIIAVEKQKMTYMLNSLYDGLIAYDLEGTIIAFNHRAEELLWVSKNDIVGKKAKDLEVKRNNLFENIQLIENVNLEDFEKRELAVATPQERVFEIILVPLVGEGKERVGAMRVIHDLTREKEIEHLKSNFVATASHQLRTPLSGIKWMLEMFIAGDFGRLNKSQSSRLQMGRKTINRLIGIINDLLDASRIEEGKIVYELKSFDVTTLIKEIMQETEIDVQLGKRKLILDIPKQLPLTIKSDYKKMKMVLRNIIDNAIKYTGDDGQIRIAVIEGKKSLLISVTDDGIGIPKRDQKYIFTKFFRASNAVRFQTEGSGLGLFIAQKITTMLNGKIIVESEEGRGSTFTVQLPLALQ